MCGILAGTRIKELEVGFSESKKRGTRGYSYYHIHELPTKIYELAGDALPILVEIPKQNTFHVYHFVTPTGSLNFHPATASGLCLWHNGMLKADYLQTLATKHQGTPTWDTKLMALELASRLDDIESCLNELDGTFACLTKIEGLGTFAFRTPTVPLFLTDYTISSVPVVTENPQQIPAERLFQIEVDDSGKLKLSELCSFQAKSNPYYFA